jgi:hypothetical protein
MTNLAHVQRLVSVLKMATVLHVYTTEEQNFVGRFLWAIRLDAKDSHKEMFTVGNVCHVKQFTAVLRNSLKGLQKSTDDAQSGAEVAETTGKRLLCRGFRHTGKAVGQVYQC